MMMQEREWIGAAGRELAIKAFGALVFAAFIGLAGCGGDANGHQGVNLTMSLTGFDGSGFTQCDQVNSTVAFVDLCADIKSDCSAFAGLTPTGITAFIVNNGQSELILDQYTVSFPANTGIPDITHRFSITLPSGQQTPVDLLLLDL